jgi:Flp pilus assembly protein TadB
VVVLLVTGWPVAALGIGLGVWFVPSVLGGQALAQREIARTEAIAAWTRRLADLLASGAVGSLDAALRRSVSACPAPIATEVAALVNRMGPQGMETALRAFADDLNDRAAEKVAGALILRSRHGGRGLAEVLSGLAADLDERVRMVREIEAERATPRSNTRTIVILTAVLIIGEIVFARGFLSPYSTLLGELGLVVVIAVFGMALRWLRRLSEPLRQPRVLTDPPTAAGPST